jgi:hypothetical protein
MAIAAIAFFWFPNRTVDGCLRLRMDVQVCENTLTP